MMKMFGKSVEIELENLLFEYETAAEMNSHNRQADVVRDVICDVTPLKFQILGPRMEKKKLQSSSERYGGTQAFSKGLAKSPCE